jgi:hypothetical protein
MLTPFRALRYNLVSFSGKLEKRVPVGCFMQESPGLQPGLSNRSGKEDQLMVQVLVEFAHRLFGRITVVNRLAS